MTIDEAIQYWEKLRKTFMEHYEKEESYWGKSHWMTSVQAIDAALSALREKAERDNPQPLTVDELRKMDGQPVWVNIMKLWALLSVRDKVVYIIYNDTSFNCLEEFEALDIKLLLYRYPPKEAHP